MEVIAEIGELIGDCRWAVDRWREGDNFSRIPRTIPSVSGGVQLKLS